MDVTIRRIDPTLPLPRYETAGAVGFDLLSRLDVEVAPQALGLIPANVIIQTPPGYVLLVALRSSTPRKKGLLAPHGIGIIDQDYCGPDDEVQIQVYNFTTAPVPVRRGEKIAQGIFLPTEQAAWRETGASGTLTRGGFGSTDRLV